MRVSNKREITVLSLGAGVQSSALAVLAAMGKISPRPEAALFADTFCEWPETYEFLAMYLRPWLEEHGLPVFTVSAGDMYEFFYSRALLPLAFGKKNEGRRRQCTRQFKIAPMKKWLRENGAQRAFVLLGITVEEGRRARPSPDKWITNVYPLVEMRWTRLDCARLLHDVGLPIPPRSRCWLCPFQPPDAWQRLFTTHPDLFERAVALEERAVARRIALGKKPLYLTGRGKPLRDVIAPVSQLVKA